MNEIEETEKSQATGKYRDCIVSYIDLNDILQILRRKSTAGIRIMRELHKLVADRAPALKAHEEICFWQDSVLLLAHIESSKATYRGVMNDVKVLKEAIDTIRPCHAVCVKGQTFPHEHVEPSREMPRIVYLSASSLAFSNCFHIEAELSNFKADWYIDSRIIRKIETRKENHVKPVRLLPTNDERDVYIYRGSFAAP